MFENNAIQVGIAPIAWTNDDMPELGKENTFEQCVSEMALAGFAGSEIGSKYPKDPAILKDALDLRGLKVANAWFSSFLTTKPYAETERDFICQCDFHKAVGASLIGVSEQGHSIQGTKLPIFDAKRILNDDEWITLAEGLDKLGKIAVDKGMTLVFHHHMGTVVQTEKETDRLMEMTKPEFVSLLFDTGHFAYSGENPLPILKKHLRRVRHVHLKDIRPKVIDVVRKEKLSFLQGVRLGTFTVPGDGSLDFKPIFQVLSDGGYNGWMLVEAEQDPAIANPLAYAMKARKYIRETAGV
jgi:inosose dehydratase